MQSSYLNGSDGVRPATNVVVWTSSPRARSIPRSLLSTVLSFHRRNSIQLGKLHAHRQSLPVLIADLSAASHICTHGLIPSFCFSFSHSHPPLQLHNTCPIFTSQKNNAVISPLLTYFNSYSSGLCISSHSPRDVFFSPPCTLFGLYLSILLPLSLSLSVRVRPFPRIRHILYS